MAVISKTSNRIFESQNGYIRGVHQFFSLRKKIREKMKMKGLILR